MRTLVILTTYKNKNTFRFVFILINKVIKLNIGIFLTSCNVHMVNLQFVAQRLVLLIGISMLRKCALQNICDPVHKGKGWKSLYVNVTKLFETLWKSFCVNFTQVYVYYIYLFYENCRKTLYVNATQVSLKEAMGPDTFTIRVGNRLYECWTINNCTLSRLCDPVYFIWMLHKYPLTRTWTFRKIVRNHCLNAS